VIALVKKRAHRFVMRTPSLQWAKMMLEFVRTIRPQLRRQLTFPARQPIGATGPRRPRVLMPQIETNHYQFFQMLVLGKALQLRGADVKVLLCGSRLAGCEIKNVNNRDWKDPCVTCRFNDRNVTAMYGLDTVRLTDLVSDEIVSAIEKVATSLSTNYPSRYLYKGINIIPIVNDSVIRFYYGAVPTDPAMLAPVRRQHLITAMISLDAAERLNGTFAPEVILNNMFVYSMAEPYFRYFANVEGVRQATVSITPVDYNSVILNIMEHFRSSERFRRYVRSRNGAPLTPTESTALRTRLEARMAGRIRMFKDLGYFKEVSGIKDVLKIDDKRRNIFLFSNIYWDLATGETGQFGDILTWIFDTIEILKDRPDVHLYIKAHPGEKYDSAPSAKGVADFIHEKFPVFPEHVTLILPEMRIKPYDLFPWIDLGLVYSGTLGLEMLLSGIPVAIAGKAPFSGLGFAHEPASLNEYAKVLLGETPPLTPNKEELQLFGYYYLIKNFVPWNLTKQAYGDVFDGYTFNSLADLMPGKNPQLDHICNCILDPDNTVIEQWQ